MAIPNLAIRIRYGSHPSTNTRPIPRRLEYACSLNINRRQIGDAKDDPQRNVEHNDGRRLLPRLLPGVGMVF